MSAGCNKDVADDPTQWKVHDITVAIDAKFEAGYANRRYWTRPPAGYDKTKAYPLTIWGQGCGQGGGTTVESQQAVFQPIALPAAAAAAARSLMTPEGKKIELAANATAAPAETVDRPGIYKLSLAGTETMVGVNLPPDESRTAAIGVEDFERWGAKPGTAQRAGQVAERQRQLKTAELESKQKLWRWLILGVLGFVAAETLLAGSLARRSASVAVA